MNSKIIYIIVAVVVVAVLVIAAVAMNDTNEANNTASNGQQAASSENEEQQEGVNATASPTAGESSEAESALTITFTDNGYDKLRYTAKVGDVITVTNESSSDSQFSSDVHPTHTEEAELNLDILAPGESQTFVVTEADTYGFHDHLDARHTGILIIE